MNHLCSYAINLRPTLDLEFCGKTTESSRLKCEETLRQLFRKYNVSEEDGFTIANDILDYINNTINDTYDTALAGGIELGELKGYKTATNEAEDAISRIAASNIMKIANGVDI